MVFFPYEIRLKKLFLNFDVVIIFKTLKTITLSNLPMAYTYDCFQQADF
jgi:hypothetical protein